ncbi:rhamnogalacturonan lyase [Clavibacter sepedonicus]|uniref:rhamnogalacturonan lyase n=1 Tax=Clavibacter sepedonicus TaxID=31964 RepID=UPI000305D739
MTRSFGVRTAAYVPVHLDKPADGTTPAGERYSYSANDTSVGDADGDGQYEFFVKWDPSDSKDNSIPGYTGPTMIDAYRMDGTRLWRIDVGTNIRAGAHYTPFQVYDYDGDGRAEIALKTADGTVDGGGVVIGDPRADFRSPDGYIKSGPEFLTIFSGLTGRAIDTIPYEPVRGDLGRTWGDLHASKADRYLAATAYLDGVHPSLVMTRDYYYRTALIAYDFDGQHLKRRWLFDSSAPGNARGASQGNHNLAVADVDGDGRDEIVYGSMTIDDDGHLLYSTGLGHGDALTVGDLDPTRPGYEAFAVHEFMERSGNRAATFRDARTGQVLWSIPGDHDTGRGLAADVDPRHPGAEAWSYGGGANGSDDAEMRTADGQFLGHQIPQPNFAAFWDGDALREMVDISSYDAARHTGVPIISKWNWTTQHRDELMVAHGTSTDNGTKGDPMLQADLLGDWREELVWRSEDSSEMRIYSTTIPTGMRLRTLMQDPMYRVGVAWQNSGYNQSPQPSFFIGAGMAPAPAPRIRVVPPRAPAAAG